MATVPAYPLACVCSALAIAYLCSVVPAADVVGGLGGVAVVTVSLQYNDLLYAIMVTKINN